VKRTHSITRQQPTKRPRKEPKPWPQTRRRARADHVSGVVFVQQFVAAAARARLLGPRTWPRVALQLLCLFHEMCC
jgi:hypothetical protein